MGMMFNIMKNIKVDPISGDLLSADEYGEKLNEYVDSGQIETHAPGWSSGIVSGLGSAYNDVTGVTTANEMERLQTKAIEEAKAAQELGYQRSLEQLDPYAQAGGQFLAPLAEGVQSGQFIPGQFNYGGQQPGKFDYQGAGQEQGFNYRDGQAGNLNYDGSQMGSTGYTGIPEMGSIQSFMGDPSQDPGYQFRMDQGLKAIDRQAAAGGRFGGGQTAKELMRFAQGTAAQGYADDFARAGQEREAQRFGETDIYGRGLTALQLQNQAEQSDYGRAGTALDLRNQVEQSGYDRRRMSFQDKQAAEQSDYNRATQQQGMEIGREQTDYDRYRTGYDYDANRLSNQFAQQQYMTGIGRDAAGAISNAAIGQGSALSNLAIQQGNAAAAAAAGRGTGLGNLLDLAGQGAKIYGAL